MFEGKAAIITFNALCLTWPYFSAFITTLNNWREGLMGQLPTLETPSMWKETTIKGSGGKQKDGEPPPPNNKPEAPGKAPHFMPMTNPF